MFEANPHPFAMEMRHGGSCGVVCVGEMEDGGWRGWLRKEGGAATTGVLRAAPHLVCAGNKVQGVM